MLLKNSNCSLTFNGYYYFTNNSLYTCRGRCRTRSCKGTWSSLWEAANLRWRLRAATFEPAISLNINIWTLIEEVYLIVRRISTNKKFRGPSPTSSLPFSLARIQCIFVILSVCIGMLACIRDACPLQNWWIFRETLHGLWKLTTDESWIVNKVNWWWNLTGDES